MNRGARAKAFAPSGRGALGMFAERDGKTPAGIRRMWHAYAERWVAWAMATGSSKAAPVAMRVEEVRALAYFFFLKLGDRAVLTPGVRPRSSAVDDESGSHTQF